MERGEELEAQRARVRTVEAELAAERQRAAAAEAEAAAARVAVEEVLAREAPRPASGHRWALGLGAALIFAIALLIGLGLRHLRYLALLESARTSAERGRREAEQRTVELERQLSRARLEPCPARGYGQAGGGAGGRQHVP